MPLPLPANPVMVDITYPAVDLETRLANDSLKPLSANERVTAYRTKQFKHYQEALEYEKQAAQLGRSIQDPAWEVPVHRNSLVVHQFEPPLPPDLERHRQNRTSIGLLKAQEDARGWALTDEMGYLNRWYDTRNPDRIIEVSRFRDCLTFSTDDSCLYSRNGSVFLNPVNHKHAVGRFYLIHDQYIRYVDPTDHEDGRQEIYDPETGEVRTVPRVGALTKWYQERAAQRNGNFYSIGHRTARIYGIDRRGTTQLE